MKLESIWREHNSIWPFFIEMEASGASKTNVPAQLFIGEGEQSSAHPDGYGDSNT
jgi:hypothetical protein